MYQMIFLIVRCVPVTFVCLHDSLWFGGTHTLQWLCEGGSRGQRFAEFKPPSKCTGRQMSLRGSALCLGWCIVYAKVYICHKVHDVMSCMAFYCAWVDLIAKPSCSGLSRKQGEHLTRPSQVEPTKMKWM